LARWIETEFHLKCIVVRDLGLARAADSEIFAKARDVSAILVTKDRDFAELVDRVGSPPAIVLLSCGNTSTAFLQDLLRERLPAALALVASGEPLVEIGGDA
jgi:predicted nuclease of predicted toxin-antitoxin system